MKFTKAEIAKCDQKIHKILNSNIITTENDGVKNHKLKKGILFFGPTGRGKTYSMFAIRNWLGGWHRGYQSNISTWQETLFAMSLHYNDGRNHPNEVDILNNKDIIYIDDLGAEKSTENSDQLLFMIINNAYENEKPLFISTNLNLLELNTRYGERITTRLSEMCEFFEMNGANRRL